MSRRSSQYVNADGSRSARVGYMAGGNPGGIAVGTGRASVGVRALRVAVARASA